MQAVGSLVSYAGPMRVSRLPATEDAGGADFVVEKGRYHQRRRTLITHQLATRLVRSACPRTAGRSAALAASTLWAQAHGQLAS